jgi:hypothetical protein
VVEAETEVKIPIDKVKYANLEGEIWRGGYKNEWRVCRCS